MNDDSPDKDSEKQAAPVARLCPRCGAQPRLLHSVPDFRSGKTARLYRCPCGERIWDEA
jgi:DNA-directed RNA polymerase subunit RPC12/RpoP